MGLTFINPLFLFGLAAGVLPILIHRLTRRKAIPRMFSAVRLILQSQRIVARPQRLKHLILLALRILTLLALVFIMARPVLTREGLLALGAGGAKVIMLDNSFSMGFRDARGTRFELAKKAAHDIIESLTGQVLLVTTSQAGRDMDARWTTPEEALRKLADVSPTFGKGDPGRSFGQIQRRMKEVTTDREMIVISDMARGDWESFDVSRLDTVMTESAVTFVRIGGANRDPNLAVKAVSLAEGEAVRGVPCRLEVRVANFSDTPASSLVQLFLSGAKVDQKSIDLKAGEEGKVNFELFLDKTGWVNGEIKLSGDQLSADDLFSFPLKVRDKVNVLIVDGDPRTSVRNSESYYIASALNPGGPEGSPFHARVVTESELRDIDLAPYEALFLLNVSRPQTGKLSSYLESGKPAFIFLGDHVIDAEYNNIPLFPWRIREVKESDGTGAARIAQVDSRHEALKVFSGSGEGGTLKNASFRRYFKIEGNTGSLLTLNNKDPLLVEATLGRGRLFLFASTADTDWNDLPLKTAYLPLVQGLVKEAVGLSRESIPTSVPLGERFEEKSEPVQITGPKGGPGIYTFPMPSGEMRRAVNPPFEESDLSKISLPELQKRFGMKNMKMVDYQGEGLGRFRAGRKELWPFFFGLLLVVLCAEMVVANRI